MERDQKQNDYYQDGDFRKRRLLVYVCTDENSVVLKFPGRTRAETLATQARGLRIRRLMIHRVLTSITCTHRFSVLISCKRTKTIMTIEIHYVWTRSFFWKGRKNHRFSKISGYVWTGPHTKCDRCLMQPLLITSIFLSNDFCIFTVMDLPTRKINYWKFDLDYHLNQRNFETGKGCSVLLLSVHEC